MIIVKRNNNQFDQLLIFLLHTTFYLKIVDGARKPSAPNIRKKEKMVRYLKRYTITNPECGQHSISFTADNNKEAIERFKKLGEQVGFFQTEIIKIISELESGELIHVRVD